MKIKDVWLDLFLFFTCYPWTSDIDLKQACHSIILKSWLMKIVGLVLGECIAHFWHLLKVLKISRHIASTTKVCFSTQFSLFYGMAANFIVQNITFLPHVWIMFILLSYLSLEYECHFCSWKKVPSYQSIIYPINH